MRAFAGRSPERLSEIDRRYSVSDRGVVYSLGLPLKQSRGGRVTLHGKVMKVSYLVARAFVPNEEGRPHVRHRNGDASDNRAENLEWCEEREDRRLGPRRLSPGGVRRLSVYGEVMAVYGSVWEAARASGVGAASIRQALRGVTRTAGGWLWSEG